MFEGKAATVEDVDDSDAGTENGSVTPIYSGPRPSLCLYYSQHPDLSVTVQYDFDSLLGYARSLAFTRQGIDINLYPRFHTNLQTDLHLYSTVSCDYGQGPKDIKVKLYMIPHYCLGRVLSYEDIAVYIFFP